MKKWIKIFIRRPILTSSLCFFILLLGIFALIKMPIRFLPAMNQAKITIHTVYPGADSHIVKNFVTYKIQNSIVGVDGVDYITSSSTTGNSEITVYLLPEANADLALSVISGKVSSVAADLPSLVKPPVISKNNIDSRAMLILGFTSNQLNRVNVAEYLRRVVAPQLESVNGISSAEVWGDHYAMQIYLRPDALIIYHLTPQDIFNALRAQNVLAAAGKIQSNYYNYNLSATTSLHTEDDFNQLIIKTIHQVPIRLQDIGYAKIGAEDDQFMVYYDNQPATFIGLQILPLANPLVTIKNILKKLPEIQKNLPVDLKIHIILDRTKYIHAALIEVMKALFESIALVWVIVFLFLGRFTAALIPIITIPLSIIGCCFFMSCFSYSINTMTLLAMVLAVSLVVDDAIVVVENCVRHLKLNHSAFDAVVVATNELVSPVIAMTITLAAIYIPVIFSGGLIGQLFTEFVVTLALSVLMSGFLALTLSPMMSARLLDFSQSQQKISVLAEQLMHYCLHHYRRVLMLIFRYKSFLFIVWLGILCSVAALYYSTPKELSPSENMGFLIASGEVPAHANRHYLEHYALAANKIYSQFSALAHFATIISPDEPYTAYLIERNLLSVPHRLSQALAHLTGINIHLLQPAALINTGPSVQFILQGNVDYAVLYRLAKKIELNALRSGMFSYLSDDLNYTQPQAVIDVNQSALVAANVSMSSVADALSILMSNNPVQQFSLNDQTYDVVIKMLSNSSSILEDLANIPIQTENQAQVLLSSLVQVDYHVVPTALNQFQKMNSVTINGEMSPPHVLSEGLGYLRSLAAAQLPKSVAINFSGASRQFYQEQNRVIYIFIFASLIIFLVLSMLFESYRSALIILLGSFPMALFAALLPLKFGLASINIYTEIGLLTLLGLISKHGILITRFADEIKKNNIDKQTAVIESALLRFRPILMTSVAILVGALPLIFSAGAGSESRHAIGLVIAFGMGIGTVLTLLLLPVIYVIFSSDG